MQGKYIYRAATDSTGTVVLAVDASELKRIDTHVDSYVAKGKSVVVLAGDRFSVEPVYPGDPGDGLEFIKAPIVYSWLQRNLPDVEEVIFLP
jgi:hypothetical protein